MSHQSKQDQIATAIDLHGRWRLELRRAVITGQLPKPAEVIADDHGCAFGHWLYGPLIDAQTRASPAWRVITRLHREYHQTAAEVARLVQLGRAAEAEALMAGDYLARSNHLLAGLRKWQGEAAAEAAGGDGRQVRPGPA
jgi:hypothetical protein